MGLGRTASIAVIALLGWGLRSHALADDDWKDGCPPYFAPEEANTNYAGLPVREDASSFGVSPEIDSSLGPSRLAIGGWFSRLIDPNPSSPTYGANPPLVYGRFVAQLNTSTGATLTLSYAAASSFDLDDHYEHSGNLQAYVGYRRATYLLGDSFRLGGAIRFGGGASPAAESQYPEHQPLIDDLNLLAARAPFNTQLFGFDRPLTLTLEGRLEMVGCHAPFVHLRADLTTWHAQTYPSMYTPARPGMPGHPSVWVLPVTISFGGYFSPRVAIFGQAGIELRHPVSVLKYEHITRVGAGLELELTKAWRLGGRLNVFTGDVDGVEVGTTLTWNLPRGVFE